ncbi:AMP-binding protein [Amycolatopsis sp. RM579]|uniref:AMP-binding protein n=1 Tax=Amycolatopsis pithecellobii TaxID=664692 RepID=A0A6N7Z5X9_9PSEU|nr:AMP-binding protein [Amycolatopsis pithecellobii]
MSMHTFWNPRTETLDRPGLERLQAAKLRRVVAWAADRSPFYRQRLADAGVTPADLHTVADVTALPLLTRDEWMAAQTASPPYGTLPAIEAHQAVRVHTTSGTTGREPLRALDTRKDWAWAAEMWCYGLWGAGVRPADTAYVAFGYGSFIGFWGLHYGLEKIGALVVPGGAQDTANRVRQIVDFGATVVASTPTYALRLAEEARALGVDLPSSTVDKVILSGEPAGSIPATKQLIEEQWGARAFDTAGMTEVSTIFMFECAYQPGGAHIIEDHLLEEVLEPGGDTPVGYGELGERVVTSFGRSAVPLLRYRTSDLVIREPGSRCACGRIFDLYSGGVRGRVDDMKLVRGTNVYPRAVESIVRGHPEISEFQLRISREGTRDEITLRVEAGRADDGLRKRLLDELAQAHEGLRFRVEFCEPGGLPRFELKARRLVDDRPEMVPAHV